MKQHILELGKITETGVFVSFTHQCLPYICSQTTKRIGTAQNTCLWFTRNRTWDRGRVTVSRSSTMILHRLTGGSRSSLTKLDAQPPQLSPPPISKLGVGGSKTPAPPPILGQGHRTGRGPGLSSFAPEASFYVLCKTASCQCLVTVSAGWQFCLYSYHRRLLFQGRGSEPPRHTNSCFCSSGPLCVCSNAQSQIEKWKGQNALVPKQARTFRGIRGWK